MFEPKPEDAVIIEPPCDHPLMRDFGAYFISGDSSGIGNSILPSPYMIIDHDYVPPHLQFSIPPSPSLNSPPLAEPVESAPAASPIARPEPERKMGTPQKRP